MLHRISHGRSATLGFGFSGPRGMWPLILQYSGISYQPIAKILRVFHVATGRLSA